jgi:hypothetical protein
MDSPGNLHNWYNDFARNYILVCPELNQAQKLIQYQCRFDTFLDQQSEAWFYNTFAKPFHSVERVQRFYPPKGDLFERLPNELVDEIFDYIVPWDGDLLAALKTDLEDFLALGLSSARLWPLMLHRIHHSYRTEDLEKWAGRKVGFHCGSSHWTEAQLKNYGQHKLKKYMQYKDWDSVNTQPEIEWRKILHGPKFDGLLEQELVEVEKDLGQMYMYPQDRVWVLRNLTTKQIVRSDRVHEPEDPAPDWDFNAPLIQDGRRARLARLRSMLREKWKRVTEKKEEKVTQQPRNLQPLTLANIFLLLTCSAQEDRSGSTYYTKFLDLSQNGAWAGCAFDLVTLSSHLSQHSSSSDTANTWSDISTAVVADICNLCFCIRAGQPSSIYDRFHFPYGPQITEYCASYWSEYWRKVEKTRKRHHAWIEKCTARPWVDERIYTGRTHEGRHPPRLSLNDVG